MIKNNIQSVCVFCGSRNGLDPKYKNTAAELGYVISKAKLKLVYGGGSTGLMGTLASSAQKNNCSILGVIPDHLMQKEVGNKNLDSLEITKDMHERKKLMYNKSDAFIVLPGGVGTLDEFFEIITWSQLGLHKKPIILLNTHNFWDKLLDLINHQVESGFVDASIANLLVTISTPRQALNYLLDPKRKLSPV